MYYDTIKFSKIKINPKIIIDVKELKTEYPMTFDIIRHLLLYLIKFNKNLNANNRHTNNMWTEAYKTCTTSIQYVK